jgi:predicted transcriptional regulator
MIEEDKELIPVNDNENEEYELTSEGRIVIKLVLAFIALFSFLTLIVIYW